MKDLNTFIEPGISQELAEHRFKIITDIYYKLFFEIPAARAEKINAIAEINFNISDTSLPLILDLKINPVEQHVQSLVVNGKNAEPDLRNDHLIIPSDLLLTGQNMVELKYQAPETSLNRNEDFLYTLLVPDRASTLFPCFDQPDLKAIYSLELNVPETWATVANGTMTTSEVTENTKKITYAPSGPFSTYLFAFAAGKFSKAEYSAGGRNFIMYHREPDSAKVARNLEDIFALHVKAYDWMEAYTGILFPFDDYEFCLIPAFAYGGMEHPGAIWYRANLLFLEEDPTRDQELRRATLIAHEVSHMWFGDLVTMKWFNDVWLKEVYANFFADLIVQDDFADIDRKLRFIYDQYPRAYRTDRSPGTHPVQQELDNLKDAGSLYGSIIYNKAPIVMKHLEIMMGEENMQAGLREYLSRYARGNASWDDLVSILSKTSGKDLSRWNNDWIKTEGQPHFIIEKSEVTTGNNQWSLRQLGKYVKEQDLMLEFIKRDRIKEFNVQAKEAETLLDLPEDLNFDYINLFGNNYEYGYYELSPQHLSWLLDHIHAEKDDSRRLIYWMTLWENFVNQKIHPNQLMPVLTYGAAIENDPFILQYILSNISALYWRFFYPQDINYKTSDRSVSQILQDRLEQEKDPKIKRMLWDSYSNLAVHPEDLERLYKTWNKERISTGLNFSEDDYISMAVSLSLNQHPEWKNIISQQLQRIQNPDSKAKFEFTATALSNESADRDEFFSRIKIPTNRRKEDWVQTGLSYLHHPSRHKESTKYLTPTLEMLQEIQKTGDIFFPYNVLQISYEYYTSDQAVQVVDNFLNSHHDYPEKLKNKIYQATDMMVRSNKIRVF
ncbi:M1 family aminopeptidase [soil metagenome]